MKRKFILSAIVGLLIIGVASAALVSYLSNTSQASVSVQSPLQTQISGDGSTWSDSISLSAYGGETKTFYLVTENKANAVINGDNTNKIVSENVTCAEFTSIYVIIDSNVGGHSETELIPASCTDGTNEVILNFGSDTWEAYRLDNATIRITFAQNAVGTYVFNSQVLMP